MGQLGLNSDGVKVNRIQAAMKPAEKLPALELALSRDQARLRRLQARSREKPEDAALREQFAQALAASVAARARRAAQAPSPSFDEDLPVAREAERIIELIAKHQVVVVAGETGSGKTTQLPKLCLAAGRGIAGMIGCTQPRRIAARAVARRVAEELQTPRRRRGRLPGALHRERRRRHLHQVHDRRHPAGRNPVRPLAVALRHAHHRRGARAQPQHRLPARLPAAAAAQAPRPEADRHLGDHRHRALRAALRRRAGGQRGRPQLSGRSALSRAGGRGRRS